MIVQCSFSKREGQKPDGHWQERLETTCLPFKVAVFTTDSALNSFREAGREQVQLRSIHPLIPSGHNICFHGQQFLMLSPVRLYRVSNVLKPDSVCKGIFRLLT